MENIPTAEEFWLSKRPQLSHIKIAREFAKLHAQAAIKAANDQARLSKNGSNVPYGEHFSEKCGTWTINHDSILNAYPLEDIK